MNYTEFWLRTNTLIKLLNKTQRGLALECGFTERRIETLSSNPNIYKEEVNNVPVKEENDTTFISPEIDFLGYFCTKYFIHGDTIFISDWFIEQADTATLQRPTAYKILYATKQRMLILPLEKDNQGNWRDSELSYPRCNILNVIEFKKVK